MLAVFYCAKLDAPLLVEIVRDGVTYAPRLRHPGTVIFELADPARTLSALAI